MRIRFIDRHLSPLSPDGEIVFNVVYTNAAGEEKQQVFREPILLGRGIGEDWRLQVLKHCADKAIPAIFREVERFVKSEEIGNWYIK